MAPRNKHFHTKEPFRENEKLALHHAEGPFRFLNPTRAHFHHTSLAPKSTPATPGETSENTPLAHPARHQTSGSEVPAKNVKFLWRSRDNRKGRHALLVEPPLPGEDAPFLTPRRSSDPREVVKNIVRTFTCYPVWDISWVVAFIFTWGSVVWVINVSDVLPVYHGF